MSTIHHTGTHHQAASALPDMPRVFDPVLAGRAITDGLEYLKKRWGWSGSKIARILHLAPNTVNTWLKNSFVPLHNTNLAMLPPDIQAIVHLLAIHRSLEAMFENPVHQRAWLTTLHPLLNMTPEEKMQTSMEDLIFVRQYLDYARGRGA